MSSRGSDGGAEARPGGSISPDAVASVAASARRSGEIILGMVGRAVSRWPFRRRVSILQLLRVVTPELCRAGRRRLPRAQCVHQALVDMGERSIEAGLPSVGAAEALDGSHAPAAPTTSLPFTPAALDALRAAIHPGQHCHSPARAAALCGALRDAAATVAADPPRAVPGCQSPPAGVSTVLRRLAARRRGPTHRTRRVPLTGFCGIVDALAERHPDLAPIAGSATARRRYCDFVLGGVASALGGDHSRGLAMRELRASNLGVALQACATGHLQRVQPFALELFTPVEQRFLAASRLGVTSRRGAATPTPSSRPAAQAERFPPAVRRAAIACLLDTATMPIRAADGRPLVDPALARILAEHAELLCLPAAHGMVSPWQFLCAIDAPVPRILRMAVRALAQRSWFRALFPSVDLRGIAATSGEDGASPRDAPGSGRHADSPTAAALRDGRISTPRSESSSPTAGKAGSFGFDADEAEAQMAVTLSFRATSLLALRLVSGAVRTLDSGEPGMLSFVDWVNLECANGYLGQLNVDWLWCSAIAGHAGPDVIPEAAVRAAAEERVWDALRLQFPPEGPASVCSDDTAKFLVEAAIEDAASAARRAAEMSTARTASTHGSASSAASSSLSMMEAPGGHFRRPVLTMRGVERSFASVPAQSVFMDGFVSPASRRQVGEAHASSRRMRKLVAQQHLTTSTSRTDRSKGSVLLSTERTPTSGRVVDGTYVEGALPLTPSVRREWLRLHAAARQDVTRILISVGDLFRPAALVGAAAGDGAVEIQVQTARRSWPAGGILPLLVDRVQVSSSQVAGGEDA